MERNATTDGAITAAVIQPVTLSHAGKVKRAITRGLLAKLIITAMMGAAITPLMTALQYKHEVDDCADRGGSR